MQNQTGNVVVSLLAGAVGAVLVLALATQQGWVQTPLGSPTLPAPDGGDETTLVPGSSHEEAVVSAVQTASPAVVSIVLTADVPVIERFYVNPFDDFFGGNSPFGFRVPQLRQRGTQRQEIGGGSGFLVTSDGLIVTNRHVVERDDVEYTVFTSDGKKYPARVVARDAALDVAMIKIEGNSFTALELGDSEELTPGQSVIAIGNALSEFRNTVSVGVISGLSRSIIAGDSTGQAELLDEVVQTDAAINPGNSGGPLINLRGQVVAVNVAVAQGSENIGFAIPINGVKPVIEAAKSGQKISRPFLGVRHIQITPALKEQENLPVEYGALVVRGADASEVAVTPGSPADLAGIVENDIILEIDGVKLDEQHSLASQIRKKRVGQAVKLRILHDGQEREVNITLAELPQE